MTPRLFKISLLTGALLAGLTAGCDWNTLPGAGDPTILAGEDGALPAVIDFRRSGVCPSGVASFSLRFSKPMARDNVQNAAAFSEILGDIRNATQPLRDAAVLPDPKSFVWEDAGRQVTFRATLLPYRMYILKLGLTVTDLTGKGLDGEVGPDVDGDGAADIVMDPGQYARIDDDYLRQPVDFTSLPFYLCDSSLASGIWRVPLNQSRPRVLELAGLIPDNDSPARYLPGTGYFPFGITDGALAVQRPLPPNGVLRLQIGTPNSAPARGFAQQNQLAPMLPSTLVGNLEITDADERDYRAVVYLDNRILVKAPVMGIIGEASGNVISSESLDGVQTDALKGMMLVAQGDNGYVFALPITGNSGRTVSVDPIFFSERRVVRPEPASTLFFPSAKFRENETKGLRLIHLAEDESIYPGDLLVEGNTANQVRFRGGGGDPGTPCPVSSLTSANPSYCYYQLHVNLLAMGFLGKPFEIVPSAVYLQTSVKRPKGQIFEVRLNLGETPITDIYGRTFVDGLADGNDRSVADEQWLGSFSSGDIASQPIPPTLQLNDGRWYSIFPNGSTVGSTLAIPPYGRYTYLGDGIMGRYEQVCQSSVPTPVLTELGMVFATPDGASAAIGADDLLWMTTVNASNFGIYRMTGLEPQSIAASVTGSTTQNDIYLNGTFLKRIPMTFVRLEPPPESTLGNLAGDDGLCNTADDQIKNKTRSWIAGDRLLISHRLRHPKGDNNSLDGNYDGVLEDGARDDIVLEYQPNTVSPFRRIP